MSRWCRRCSHWSRRYMSEGSYSTDTSSQPHQRLCSTMPHRRRRCKLHWYKWQPMIGRSRPANLASRRPGSIRWCTYLRVNCTRDPSCTCIWLSRSAQYRSDVPRTRQPCSTVHSYKSERRWSNTEWRLPGRPPPFHLCPGSHPCRRSLRFRQSHPCSSFLQRLSSHHLGRLRRPRGYRRVHRSPVGHRRWHHQQARAHRWRPCHLRPWGRQLQSCRQPRPCRSFHLPRRGHLSSHRRCRRPRAGRPRHRSLHPPPRS